MNAKSVLVGVFCSAVFSLLTASAAPEGEADENGNWIAKPGESKSEPAGVSKSVSSDWGTEPLGEMGKLDLPQTAKAPVYGHAPSFAPGLKIFGSGVRAVIVSPNVNENDPHRIRNEQKLVRCLAKEFAWHLSRMTDSEFEVVGKVPPQNGRPVVFFADSKTAQERFGIDLAKEPVGAGVIRQKGNTLVVCGTRSGISHALTYLLERLGCRYLYPGKGGKVIPKGLTEVVLPKIDGWSYVPDVRMRRIRMGAPRERDIAKTVSKDRGARAMRDGGLKPAEVILARIAARRDENPENRDFMAWHGISDKQPFSGDGGFLESNELDSDYSAGHSFRDYYARFHKTHPEFFALQPDGSREQGPKLGKKLERATLCLSNQGLVEATVQDVLAAFRKGQRSASISLPDGGACSQCMCANCRRLDPPNAVKTTMRFGAPVNAELPIVALTDRYLTFANNVAAAVKKEFPDRHLCCQAYAKYSAAPVRVRPDPMLVIFPVGSFRDWMAFGNPIFWRPNLFRQWFSLSPQSQAREYFETIRLGAANGLMGTDIDCYSDEWGVFGFDYYMVAKALNDPDRRDFDTIADDYFATGFGKAAPAMKDYWRIAADAHDVCKRQRKEKKDDSPAFVLYGKTLDLAALEGKIAEARKLAAGDAEVLARIDFFASALVPAKLERKIVDAVQTHDKAAGEAAQRALREFVRKDSVALGLSVSPGRMLNWRATPSVFYKEW